MVILVVVLAVVLTWAAGRGFIEASLTGNLYCWGKRRGREVSAVTVVWEKRGHGSSVWCVLRCSVMGIEKLEAGAIEADAPGKVRHIIVRRIVVTHILVRRNTGRLSDGTNERTLLKFWEREIAGEVPATVEHLGSAAIQKNPPGISRSSRWKMTGRGHLGEDVGRAIVGGSVEPAWVVAQAIRLLQVLEKEETRPFRAGNHVVEVNVLAGSIVGAEADEIAFVRHHVNNGELTKEGADGRVALADLITRLNRCRHVVGISIAELEADDGR